jgi:hypothetical protein
VHIDIGAHAGIGRVLLLVRIETVIVAFILARHVIRQFIEFEPLAAHLILVDRCAEGREDRVPIVFHVVDRNVPLRDRHLAAHRNDEGVGEDQIGDADVRLLAADLAECDEAEPIVGRLDLDARPRKLAHDLRHRHVGVLRGIPEHLAVALVRVFILEEAVQERGVHRIDADLERLQPLAIDHALERECMARRRDEAVEARKRRRPARAEIGKQNAALLHDRIGFLLDAGAQVAVVGFGRRLQAFAADVEQPAVKRAAQSAVFETPVS